jgi:hypothetical protein
LPYSYLAPQIKLELRPPPETNRALATEAWLIIPNNRSQSMSLIDVKMLKGHQLKLPISIKPSRNIHPEHSQDEPSREYVQVV